MYSEVLIAKYSGSRMNDAHTVCPADFASLPAKVIWPTAFFSNSASIFVQLLCWPLPVKLGVSTWVVFNIATSRLNIYFRIGVYMSIKIL